ncbi:MAG: hypothetical protein K2O00_01390 [Muribaculaceae bacterium]|nr:hypothetical protein [Muribaculaceae bacterium]
MRISELSAEVYKKIYSIEQLSEAWLDRGNDPVIFLNSDKPLSINQKLLLKYHSKDVRNDYNSIIEIDTFDIFDSDDLTSLQLLLLQYMHDKDIVIETLPTSNVTIGVHHSYSSYHLYNWYKWSKNGNPVPPIVVGTDDAGIFATNIYNEYCNIFCFLKNEKHMNINEIITFIKQLHYNSVIYGFDSLT